MGSVHERGKPWDKWMLLLRCVYWDALMTSAMVAPVLLLIQDKGTLHGHKIA